MSLLLNALFKKYASQIADIDAADSAASADFNLLKKDLGSDKKTDLKALADNMSAKGLAHSGASLKGNTNLRKAYGRSASNADAAYSRYQNTSQRNRIKAKNELDEGKANATLEGLLE